MPELSPVQWLLLALGALATGLSKTGVAGLGILSVALFANALPPRESTGALLPLLIAADVFGVAIYRQHADWRHIWKLFPWVVAGVVLGCLAMSWARAGQIGRLIGAIVIAMTTLHLWRRRQTARDPDGFAARLPHALWFAAFTGVLAGFSTMVADAAGPVMILYFFAMGLPKMRFLGTMAWFFFFVNVFKVPFSWRLGLLGADSLILDGLLLPPLLLGVALGPRIVRNLPERAFERMVLWLTVAAAIRLLL